MNTTRRKKLFANESAFSLMEVLVSVFIIMILTLGVYNLIILSLKLEADNKMYVEAVEILNQKMEQIRNMPYDDVGVVSGIPSGPIPQEEIINREGIFTVNNYVIFHDDPYDGEIGSTTNPDTIGVDYKIASVKVTWQTSNGEKTITSFSKIIPHTEETASGYGLLKIYVVDSNGLPVTAADVRVYNDSLASGTVDVTNPTNSEGILYLPAQESFMGYQITVTKPGYGTEMTYAASAENPSPTKPNLSVTEGNKTEETFTIDLLATLEIHTVTDTLPDNWQVNSSIGSTTNTNVRFTLDASDNLFYTWTNESSTSTKIYVQKYNSAGVKQWSSDLGIYSSQFQSNSDIAVTNSGQVFVVWQDNSATLKSITLANTTRFAQERQKSLTFKQKIKPTNISKLPSLDSYFLPGLNYFNNQSIHYILDSNSKFFKKLSFDVINFKDILSLNIAQAAGLISVVAIGPGNTDDGGDDITLSKPSGVQDGDFLLAYIFKVYDGYGSITPPGGWSTLDNNFSPSGSGSNARGAIFYKFAGSSEPSNYTFETYDFTNSNFHSAGHIRAYRGVDPSSPFDGSLLTQSTTDGDLPRPAPSHTVTNDGSMLISGWGANTWSLGNGGPSFPTGMSNTINNYTSYVTTASADEQVDSSDSPTGNKYYDANQNVIRSSIGWSLVLNPENIADEITLSSIGSQISSSTPDTDIYLGGAFTLSTDNGTHNINRITINENGSIDALNHLSNIKINYDFDITAPYDCAGEIYNSGSDPQFGFASSSFSSADGKADFVDSGISISPTQSLCIYVSTDISSGISGGEEIKILISDPVNDIGVGSGTVLPSSAVLLSGTTETVLPAETNQIHYRWRYDDGDETSASWQNLEDTNTSITSSETIRLRLAVSNSGGQAAPAANFRLEYSQNSSCSSAGSWTALPTDNSGHWKIIDSSFLNDSDPSANSADLNDGASNFTSGEIKDLANQTSAITLDADTFTELEFSLSPTPSINDANYCFRLTNAGLPDDFTYTVYPQITIIGDYNVYIKSLNSDGSDAWAVKRVNTDLASEYQGEPKIAISQNFGAATTTVVWSDGRNGNLDIYAMAFDSSGNELWGADLQITSTSSDAYSPTVGISQNDELFIAWTEEDTISKNIYLDKYDLLGNHLWSDPIAIADSNFDEYDPQISFNASGNPLIAWTEDIMGIKNIKLALWNTSGIMNWEITPNLGANSYDQEEPDVFADSSNIYIGWTDKREGNFDIYAQKYDYTPSAIWSNDLRININTGTSEQKNPQVLINSSAEPFGVWEDGRNGDYNIFSTEFNDPSALNDASYIPLKITGTKRIGESPVIYEYNATSTTAVNGSLSLPLEWDSEGYSIEIDTDQSSDSIKFTDPIRPVKMLADETKNIIIYID